MKQCNRCGGIGEHTIDCILQSQEDYLKARESFEKCSPYHGFLGQPQTPEQLKAMIEAAVLAEREACAKVCEELERKFEQDYCDEEACVANECAAAIRTRRD